jgi:hypothetical protein
MVQIDLRLRVFFLHVRGSRKIIPTQVHGYLLMFNGQ